MTEHEGRSDTGAPAGPWVIERGSSLFVPDAEASWYVWNATEKREFGPFQQAEANAIRDALNAKSAAPRPEPLRPEPCAMNARCERCTRLIYGSVPDSTCAPFADCALKAYRAALRGAPALPPQPTRDTEHQHLRDMMRRIAEALGHSSAGVLELTCKDGESPAERLAREVEELVRARSSLPSGPPENAVPGEPPYSGNTAKRSAARLVHTHTPVDHSAGPLSVEQLARTLKTAHGLAREGGARNWDMGDADMPMQMARIIAPRLAGVSPATTEPTP